MNRSLLLLACSVLCFSVNLSAELDTTSADRMNILITEMMEAQSRGDQDRVQAIAAEMEALAPQVRTEMNSRVDAANQQNPSDIQQRMQQQFAAMQQQANSPENKISLAARKGDLTEVKRLHEAGARINFYHFDPGPPLMEAAINGRLDVAQYLLEKGADLRVSQGMMTLDALRLAAEAKEDNSAMLVLLVKYGALAKGNLENMGSVMLKQSEQQGRHHASVKANEITSGSALTAAIEKGRIKHVATLLELGANANDWAFGKSALMLAAKKLQPEIVKLLLDHGADKSAVSQDQKTALQWAQATKETSQNAGRRRAVLERLTSD